MKKRRLCSPASNYIGYLKVILTDKFIFTSHWIRSFHGSRNTSSIRFKLLYDSISTDLLPLAN